MGENIAYGYPTPQDVMTGWLNSPGHKANIENASYRAIGIGAAGSTVFWAQDFGTTDDYRRRDAAAPPRYERARTAGRRPAPPTSQVNLTRGAANDNVGVTGYRVYRGATQIGTTAGTSFSDTGPASARPTATRCGHTTRPATSARR